MLVKLETEVVLNHIAFPMATLLGERGVEVLRVRGCDHEQVVVSQTGDSTFLQDQVYSHHSHDSLFSRSPATV